MIQRVLSILLFPLLFFGTLWAQEKPDSTLSVAYKWYPRYVTFLPSDKLDSVLMYAQTRIVPVIYKVNKYDLHATAQLDSITALIRRIQDDDRVALAYVWVGGSASPEGPVRWNKQLGHYRSKALADYLRAHTSLSDSQLRVENLEEDWLSVVYALRQIDFPHKDSILHIIHNEADWVRRKERIKAIDNGRVWSRLIHTVFPPFRNARMVIVCHAELIHTSPQTAFPPVFPVTLPPERLQPVALPPRPQSRFIALKSNALFAAALVANLGFEVELWPKWSLDVPVFYSPYDITSTRKLRLLAVQPELRYWTKKAGEGHFVGLHTHVVGFNVAVNDHGRYQDPNHALWGMGLSYGYSRLLGVRKRWAVEFTIGAGFAEYDYDAYRNYTNGPKFRSGSNLYWGITRAGISFSYRWNKPRKTRQ